jgi:ABC-type branched-subunit amino acid transport system substrate-binding protein
MEQRSVDCRTSRTELADRRHDPRQRAVTLRQGRSPHTSATCGGPSVKTWVVSLLTALVLASGAGWAQGDATNAAPPLQIGIILPPQTNLDPLQAAVATSARQGTVMAEDELGQNAALLGMPFKTIVETASTPEQATAAAQALVKRGVVALIGGGSDSAVLAMTKVADDAKIPLLNILAPADNLRNKDCSPYLFDIAPSTAMELDALEGWFVGSGFRRWVFVTTDDATGKAMVDRAEQGMKQRHFAAQVTGVVRVSADQASAAATLQAVKKGTPDVVVLLLPAQQQLAFARAFAGAGIDAQLTGLPYPAAETRTFYKAWLAAAGEAKGAYRAEAWEATLDSYGATQLNMRFEQRFHAPMDAASWAAYQGIKILYDTFTAGGATTSNAIVAFFENSTTVFDVWKGIGTSFRPWDHQLRQSLFLAHLEKDGSVTLVGELPAIYRPGTSPIERLDQLGDLKGTSRCHL